MKYKFVYHSHVQDFDPILQFLAFLHDDREYLDIKIDHSIKTLYNVTRKVNNE